MTLKTLDNLDFLIIRWILKIIKNLTVNLPAYVYVGSNPTPSTIKFKMPIYVQYTLFLTH